jgi:hypothetical protein
LLSEPATKILSKSPIAARYGVSSSLPYPFKNKNGSTKRYNSWEVRGKEYGTGSKE